MWYQQRFSSRFFFLACVLFVSVIVIYSAHRSYSQLQFQFTDGNITIEKALEEIPICTPSDRRRQRIHLNLLQTWAHLAEKHKLEYWISYGTLVGYVQRRGLLPHDGDVDIIMMSDDVPKLILVSQLNFSSKYEITVQPHWMIVGETKRSYFRDQGVNFVAPDARFRNRETRDHIDIYPAYDFDPRQSTKRTQNLTIYDLSYDWVSYPRNWTYPLRSCYFSNIKVLCPAQPEKIVTLIYGAKAVTTSDHKCVNGSWVDAF